MPTHFVMQTTAGLLSHDFTWALREALDYWAWWDPDVRDQYYVTYADTWPNTFTPTPPQTVTIPVGSLEWVGIWTEQHYHRPLESFRPIYIPPSLRTAPWLGRSLTYTTRDTLLASNQTQPMFLKSATTYKRFTDICIPSPDLPHDDYWVSEPVTFLAEWRAFVHRQKLVGLQRYAGDLTVFPDTATLTAMIQAYGNEAPFAYTLDVGILDAPHTPTVIVEVHPFVSCGLYGFDDWSRLIHLVIDGWRGWIRTAGLPDPYHPSSNVP